MLEYLYPILCFFGYGIASLLSALLTVALQGDNITQVGIISLFRAVFSFTILGLIIFHPTLSLIIGAILGEVGGDLAAMYLKRWWKPRQKEQKDETHY